LGFTLVQKKLGKDQIKKTKMLAEASILFWKKGYQGTSMRDIANGYGCKPANIYNFFPNKESLLYEILLEQMQRIVLPIRSLGNDTVSNPIEQLRFLITKHLMATLGYEKSYKLLYDVGLDNLSLAKRKKIVSLRDEYEKILRKIIHSGISSGDFAAMDEKLAVYAISSMIARTMLWYSPKGRLSKDVIIDFIFRFALSGLQGGNKSKR
jgi:AcrR family transcriptional regulator